MMNEGVKDLALCKLPIEEFLLFNTIDQFTMFIFRKYLYTYDTM